MNNSIYRYPGGKTKLLPQIFPYIQKSIENRKAFCDLFVGGGSCLLAVASKYPKLQLFANDKDDFIFSFWDLMSNGTLDEIEALKQMLNIKPTTELFYKLRNIKPTSRIELAFYGIFFNRTSFSGDMRRNSSPIGGRKQQSKYTIDCRYNVKKIIEKIDNIHKLLKNRVIVSNIDINEYLINDDSIAIYADPPYVLKGSMLYEKYMTFEEHKNLSIKLKNYNNWVLSYDNCKEILKLYEWANINIINASYCIKGNKTNWNLTNELLILPI